MSRKILCLLMGGRNSTRVHFGHRLLQMIPDFLRPLTTWMPARHPSPQVNSFPDDSVSAES